MKIGIISDTHGLLRREAKEIFDGCYIIFHAGDIGKASIIDELAAIAPVTAVKGNNDKEQWAQNLPEETCTKVCGKTIYMIHNLKESQAAFDEGGIDIVISGHSHIYKDEIRGGILYLNPGGAGPRRFGRMPSVMTVEVNGEKIEVFKRML